MSKLSKAVEQWLKADYTFRHGTFSYSTRRQNEYVDAEEELREALTGEKDIRRAYIKMRRKQKNRGV